ncbi:MAG: hypothetical protein JOZ41_03190 [Chloroflexi bacterium]|nr:hypothetical protein [Chloroflexota bacterium]
MVETIRQNPIPAALAGLGLGWLFWSGRKQSSTSGYRAYSYERPYGYNRQYDYGYTPYRGAGSAYGSGYQPSAYGGQQQYGADYQGQDRSAAGQAAERVQGAVGQAQDMAGHVADQTQNVAGQVQDAAGQMANQVQGTAGQVAGQVQDTAQQLGYQAQYQTQRAVSGFQQMLDERPLAVAAGAVALGLAVGLAIPSTPQEDRLMGEARDNLVQQAQQTAQDTAQKVQSVAQEAVGAAKSEAHEQFSQGS